MGDQSEEKGIIPCSNCIVTVPQDRVYAVETFGSFSKMISPGLRWTGPDLFGVCVTLKSCSTRMDQYMVVVPTKTRDNTFVRVECAVQMAVCPDQAQDAFYKMGNLHQQLDSYVSDVVRATLPTLSLDQAFEEKDTISNQVQQLLGEQMKQYGWEVHKALITDLKVNSDVMHAMNEINRQARLRDAAQMEAEASKIRTVKEAEAKADSSCLQGEGIARQRAAIVQGLRDSLRGGSQQAEVSQDDIMALLLTTQYFETLKEMGSRSTSKSFFLPKEDPNDVDTQIRSGMLQGQVGLEAMVSSAGHHHHQDEAVSQFPSAATPARSYQPSPVRSYQPQLASFDTPSESESFSSDSDWSPPRAPQARAPVTLQVQVPPGAQPGAVIQVQAPDGRVVQVQVPRGIQPGQVMQVQV